MQKELKTEGKDIAFVAVNSLDAIPDQPNLVSKCDFPLLQDTDAVTAWKKMGGAKDDLYVYGSDGKLARFLPFGGPVSTILSDPIDYANVKKIVADTK